MVKIRLTRKGTTKKPFYRIVVAESSFPRDGRFIEIVGTYDPRNEKTGITVQGDRIRYWLNHGAQPTNTVRSLLKANGISPKSEPKKSEASVVA